MLKLRTIFPYGLNDRVGDEYKSDESTYVVGRRFPPLKRQFHRVSRGINRKGSNSFSYTDFFCKLNEYLTCTLKDCLNFIRISISSMKKSAL